MGNKGEGEGGERSEMHAEYVPCGTAKCFGVRIPKGANWEEGDEEDRQVGNS